MSDEKLTVKTIMPNYNGLSRAGLIPKIGMPIVPTLISIVVPLFISMIGLSFLGNKAFSIMLISIPLLGFIWTVTQDDDQALRVIGYSVKWLTLRRNYFLFGQTNTVLAVKYGRQKNDYIQFFEEHSKKTRQEYQYNPLKR
jgi:type IV secretion system protein VirB3